MSLPSLPTHKDHIRIEQLRLLLGNLGSSALPGITVALILTWTLSNDSNRWWLVAWCGVVSISKLVDVLDARRILAAEITGQQSRRLVWRLIGLHAVDGAVWGALSWVTLSNTSTTGSILVFAVLSGIAGNSMSLLSPVLPVFVAFCVCELGMIAVKTWQMHDPAYSALGITVVLYLFTLYGQARNSAKAVRAAIQLRFENMDLISCLRIESEKSQLARQEAEQATLAKSKFLAAASHDLRQPIHAQGLFLEVLGRSELTVAQRDLLSSARSASEASANMLHTLLDYSRIEAGVIEPQIRAFRLQPLLNKIENELAPQADIKGIVYRSRETHVAVNSDPALLELILRNLISNAIRYTEHGGVLIACRVHGKTAQLEVWDTGIGISSEQHDEVFREFHQLGNQERNRQNGLGLGLSIVQALARLLKHDLLLESKLQRGSVFKLLLPLAEAAVVEDEPENAVSCMLPLQARVLVIDDDELVRNSMRCLLLDWSCDCLVAATAEEAIALAHASTPDLIISDFRLQGQYTGTEAIKAVRAAIGLSVPGLLITGDTAPVRLREALASGLPLLHKPVSPAQLHRRLSDMLSLPDEVCSTII